MSVDVFDWQQVAEPFVRGLAELAEHIEVCDRTKDAARDVAKIREALATWERFEYHLSGQSTADGLPADEVVAGELREWEAFWNLIRDNMRNWWD